MQFPGEFFFESTEGARKTQFGSNVFLFVYLLCLMI